MSDKPNDNYDPKGSAQVVQDNLNFHTNNTVIHVSQENKNYWDNKSDAHQHPYAPIVHVDDTVKHITAEERSTWNAAITIEQGELNGVWYRKWSNGWLEQGGVRSATLASSPTITLAVNFINTTYTVVGSVYWPPNPNNRPVSVGGGFEFTNRQTGSFNAYIHDGGNDAWYTGPVAWYACGYWK